MAIRDEIAAIRADGEGDKPRRIRRLKAERFIAALQDRLPLSWDRGQWTIIVARARLGGRTDDDLELLIRVERGGNILLRLNDPANPFVFCNPPVLVRDDAGEVDLGERGKYRESLTDAFRSMVEETVETVLRARQ